MALAAVTLDDKSFTLSQWDIIHVPGLAFDGISGMSPIRYAAESIGLNPVAVKTVAFTLSAACAGLALPASASRSSSR